MFGLGLAMITLAWEVFYYKRKEKNKKHQIEAIDKTFPPKKIKKKSNSVARLRKVNIKNVTIGDKFKPVTGKVSFINVLPKNEFVP